ncbi:MAG: HD domain-containing protein [Magnetococcales bacterium]|nr:HD domain-containing protein [Magnetococcales bacterium]
MIYIPIPIGELPINETYGFDLYLTYNKKYVLFRSRQLPVDENVLLQLRENGVEKIYIEKGDYPKFLRLTARVAGYSGDNSQIRYLQDKFVFIDIHTLRVGSSPNFTVFVVESGLPTPIISPDLPGVPTTVNEQHLLEYTSAYIFQGDLDNYSAYLQNSWAEEATYQPMNVAGGILMRENAKMAAHGLFRSQDPKEALPMANKAIDQMLDSMFDNSSTFYALLKVSDQDFNTYIHSVNVAVLSMGLGIRLKLSQFQLQLLGLGSMLHDIGKTRVDPDLLLKKSKISPSEYESLREHVILGVEWCKEVPEIPSDVLPIIAQHHEQMDGTGYPDKLKVGQIDPLAQIVNIMEIYDSLTNRQPFRDAFSPFQSLGKMREMGKAINQEFLTQFILMLGEQHRPT